LPECPSCCACPYTHHCPRHRPFPAAPFIAGILLRLFAIGIPNNQVSDFKIFEELAESLVNNTGFSYTGATGLSADVASYMNNSGARPPVATAFRLPMYPMLLSVMFPFY